MMGESQNEVSAFAGAVKAALASHKLAEYPTDFELLEAAEAEVERLTALGDAMCAGARNTDYAMLHEACSAWEQRDMKGGGAMTTEVGASK